MKCVSCVDIWAPGEDILSSLPSRTTNSAYEVLSGTLKRVDITIKFPTMSMFNFQERAWQPLT